MQFLQRKRLEKLSHNAKKDTFFFKLGPDIGIIRKGTRLLPVRSSNDPIDNDLVIDLLTLSPIRHVTLDQTTITPGIRSISNEFISLHPTFESSIIVRSPVLIDGIDMYEEILTDALENLQISSGKIELDVIASPHYNKEVSTEEIADFLDSQCNVELNNYNTISEEAPARQLISRPSFDILSDYHSDAIEQLQHTSEYNSPTKIKTSETDKPATPYIYSRTNLIVMVEEGQSMFAKLRDDCRYQKIKILTEEGVTRGQLHLKNEYAIAVEQKNSVDGFNIPVTNGTLSGDQKLVSSPDFWASVVASAEEIECNMKSKDKVVRDDLFEVARRIDFTEMKQNSVESPYVSSMIKRMKARTFEKGEKKMNDEERLFVNQNNGETSANLNQNTKRLVMNLEYNYLFFFMINNDSVFCNGSDLQDIVRHRLYTPLLVKVFAGVSRAELVEKSIHEAKFQFVNPDLFDDEGFNRSSEVLPEKLSYIAAEQIDGMITRSMRGQYKRLARYFIIPMRTVKH
ncbi:hypothetical protein ZOSMA_172G00080 [Zostera marina]|uniref:Uncharacterized protein n=1 Tax=Zostera marina TaxID=29655 RepID=A0A0K9PUE5_ZOSMR|nr:hypothetical protein ZOSMA_172G00080 [Zostera marina]